MNWINMNDARPIKEGLKVMVFVPPAGIDVMYWVGNEYWMETDGGYCPFEYVTHWASLPEAP